MAEHNPSIDVLEKDIDWSSSIGTTMPVSGAEVHQRVEKITPTLLDNSVIRIQAVIKLFAVVTTEKEQKHLFKPAKVFTHNVDINTFVNLHAEINREDITSIEHQVVITKSVPRPDKIIVSGTLKLKISYVFHLALDGLVTEFSNGAPIVGATINATTLENHEIVASTNTGKNGRYFFNNLPPGAYLIEANADSHKPDQKVSLVKIRDTVNFVLHK